MKIVLLLIGKTDEKYLEEGIQKYIKRLEHYISFEMVVIPALKNNKNMSEEIQKTKEGEEILIQLKAGDKLFLMDENGKEHTSRGFAEFIERQMIQGGKCLVLCIGGPYGFSEAVYQRADGKLSLSKMTFSHQMVRLIFVEQLYRAFTILKGEPYHHD